MFMFNDMEKRSFNPNFHIVERLLVGIYVIVLMWFSSHRKHNAPI